MCLAWLTADIQDTFEVLALTLLEQILLGNSASPLRKALIDSALGSALCDGTGFDADNRDTLFVAGLKDVEQAAADKIEEIIVGVLRDLVEKGIDKNLIDSAIHQIEFHRKEITNTPYPYGIKLLLSFSGSWFHGGDPVKILNFDADLAKLQTELAKGAFFENCIQKYFLDNPHRVLLTLVPDQEMEQNETRRVRAELDRIKKELSRSDIDRIKQDAEALKASAGNRRGCFLPAHPAARRHSTVCSHYQGKCIRGCRARPPFTTRQHPVLFISRRPPEPVYYPLRCYRWPRFSVTRFRGWAPPSGIMPRWHSASMHIREVSDYQPTPAPDLTTPGIACPLSHLMENVF